MGHAGGGRVGGFKVGDAVPDVLVYATPERRVSLREWSAGKTVILVGIPGAFTHTCHTVRGGCAPPRTHTRTHTRVNEQERKRQ